MPSKPHCLTALGVVIILVSVATCVPAAAAEGALDAGGPLRGATGRQPAVCRAVIQGGPAGSIKAASLECTGGQVYMEVHEKLLWRFSSMFRGVHRLPTNRNHPCLLAVVKQADVVIVNSTIQGVSTEPGTNLDTIMCVKDSSRLHVLHSKIKGNMARGLASYDMSRLIMTRSVVEGNVVLGRGAGVYVLGSAKALITDKSRLEGNVALQGAGGGLALADEATATVSGHSVLYNNTAFNASGGGAVVSNKARLCLAGESEVANNTSIAFGGGGIWAKDSSSLVVSGHSMVRFNRARNHTGQGIVDQKRWTGGGILADRNASLVITGQSTISHNCAYSGGGINVMHSAKASVTLGSIIAHNVAIEGFGGGIYLTDYGVANITSGALIHNNTQWSYMKAGSDVTAASYNKVELYIDATVQIDHGLSNICGSTVLITKPCQAGMYVAGFLCQCCPAGSYSFELNVTASDCRSCPAYAKCIGRDQVVPISSYWHSSPRSVQMHRCPNAAACGEDGQCQPEYQGNLCAGCVPGYGMTLPFRCGRCMAPGRQFGAYAALSSITVVFITCTVFFTYKDNCEGAAHVRASDLTKVLVQFLQYLVILGSITAPWPHVLRALFAASTVVFGAASGQALSVDCWLEHYVPAARPPLAIQRQLLNFITPGALALCAGALLLLGITIKFVWGCCCTSSTRRGMFRGGFTMQASGLLQQLCVLIIVVCYYAYPTLVKASLSFFACVRIDDPSQKLYAQYAVLNHTAGYWVYDTSQECFAGWHRVWALCLGLPALLLTCAGVPLGLFWLLYANRARADNPDFRAYFGFLYRNYTDTKVWWEAVWAVQTVLLTTVAVFHYTVQAYYAVVLLALMFLGSAVLQAAAQPCAAPQLHVMQLAASVCLFLTAYCSLVFFTMAGYDAPGASVTDAAPAHHTALGVILIVMNCVMILWCLAVIAMAAFSPTSWVCRYLPCTGAVRRFCWHCNAWCAAGSSRGVTLKPPNK